MVSQTNSEFGKLLKEEAGYKLKNKNITIRPVENTSMMMKLVLVLKVPESDTGSEVVSVTYIKPAHVQDADYMIEKTNHLTPHLGPFGAYLILK